MKVKFVDLHRQYLSIKEEIDAAILNTIQQTSFIGGTDVDRFEKEYSSLYNNSSVVGCANGTDSMEIILKAQGIGNGDEVLVPAMTWISSAEVVSNVGAKPVFVDVDSNALFDIEKAGRYVNKKTKAIIPVHLYGQPVNMFKLMEFAKGNSLFVLEDCAQAHLAEWDGKKVGLFGDAASFSFYPGKNLGAYGDAGAMLFGNIDLASKSRMIAKHGQSKKHTHHIIGRNSRLDGLQAAVLRVKLRYLEKWTNRRIELANIYQNELRSLTQIRMLSNSVHSKNVYHVFPVFSDRRDDLKKYLLSQGIQTAVHYPNAITETGAYWTQERHENAIVISKTALSIPLFPEMTESELLYVVEKIKQFFSNV